MKYHVNPQTGNTGLCRARRACPFGGDDLHYESKDDARAAYESWMSGKGPTFPPSAFVDEKAAKQAEEYARGYERELAKLEAREAERAAFVRGMKPTTTVVPPEVAPGYLRVFHGPKAGEPAEMGGTVLRVDYNNFDEAFVTAKDGEHQYTYKVMPTEDNRREEWVDEPDPKLVEERKAALRERDIEDFYLNHMNFRSRARIFFNIDVDDSIQKASKMTLADLRAFKAKAAQYVAEGVPNPYSQAYAATQPNPHIDFRRASAFSLIVTGQELTGNPYSYGSGGDFYRPRRVALAVYPSGSFSYPGERERVLQDRLKLDQA